MPSILDRFGKDSKVLQWGFKPYYNWNAFNTFILSPDDFLFTVLNLIITGMPSILMQKEISLEKSVSFKPYYNWNAFNTHSTDMYKFS